MMYGNKSITRNLEWEKQYHRVYREVPIDEVQYGDRARPVDLDYVRDELVPSIIRRGLINPIGVRHDAADGRLLLVHGAHRLAAYQELYARAAAADDEGGKLEWSSIRCHVYGKSMPPEIALGIELEENLQRNDLTREERNEHSATLLELNKPKTVNDRFKAPAQKEVVKLLGTTDKTFRRAIKEFKDHAGITSSWAKFTAAEYDQLIQWFRNREKLAAEEEKATREREKAEEVARKKAASTAAYKAAEAKKKERVIPVTPAYEQEKEQEVKPEPQPTPRGEETVEPEKPKPRPKPKPLPETVHDLLKVARETEEREYNKLTQSLTPAQKGKLTKMRNDQIRREVVTRVTAELREERAELLAIKRAYENGMITVDTGRTTKTDYLKARSILNPKQDGAVPTRKEIDWLAGWFSKLMGTQMRGAK